MAEQGTYVGEKRKVGGYDSYWTGSAWSMDKPKESSSPASVSTEPAKPKVQTKGTAGVSETQTKSLSQILAEREEKKKKAAMIREGGTK
jgi:hypothetical protein